MTMQVSIHGRLGRDPREIQTSTGTVMAVAPMVVNIPLSRGDDSEPCWFDLLAFGKTAETLLRHNKGEMVNIMGTLKINRWDNNGETRDSQQVIIDSLLSARTTRSGGGRKSTHKKHEATASFQADDEFHDELQF